MYKLSQEVIVIDDGKRSRCTIGVISAIGDDFMVINHTLWGYGNEPVQKPLPHLYRKSETGLWYSYQTQYHTGGEVLDIPGGLIEYTQLVDNPTDEMWERANEYKLKE